MNYEWFPFDSQVCPVLLESYAYRAHQLVVEWHEEDPFQVAKFKIPLTFHVKLFMNLLKV